MKVLIDLELFPDLVFAERSREEPKPKVKEPFLQAEMILNNVRKRCQEFADELDHHLDFNDLDAVSDSVDNYQADLSKFTEEIDHYKKNPCDILKDFNPKSRKAKFRRYANNKRTNKKFREDKLRKTDNVRFSH